MVVYYVPCRHCLTHTIHAEGVFQLVATHSAAIELAFSSPKCFANSSAMDSVLERVPYKSNPMTTSSEDVILGIFYVWSDGSTYAT